MQRVIDLMEKEVALHQVQKSIHGRVKKQMEKSQREYYLNEQMKAIQRELGSLDDVPNELDELARKVVAAKMPEGGARQGRGRVVEAEAHGAHVAGGDGGAGVPRLAGEHPVEANVAGCAAI